MKTAKKKRQLGSTKKKKVTRVKQISFNYGFRCDWTGCSASTKKGKTIWSYKNKYGRMESRCKVHLKKPNNKRGPKPEMITK